MFDSIMMEKLSEIFIRKQNLIKRYDRLYEYIRNSTDRNQIKNIREDEIKHINIVKGIYSRISGGRVLECSIDNKKKELSKKDIERIIYTEADIIKTTKAIMLSIPDLRIRNGLYYIFTDDQRHADMMIFLYTKYL